MGERDDTIQTIPGLLHQGVSLWPDRELVTLESGEGWTWARCLAEAADAANALRERGVGRGDRVIVMLPNGADWLRAWWGTALLGAVVAPFNPAYRGQLLADLCGRVDAGLIVTDADPDPLFPAEFRDRILHPDRMRSGNPQVPPLDPPAQPWDQHCLLMTSGTTGPSKASITTHAYLVSLCGWLIEGARLTERDVFQADMPWFHLSSLAPAVQMLRVGGRITVRTAPAMTSYWQTARELGSTFATSAGTVAQFLVAQPESAADRDHAMRFITTAPLPADPAAFIARFGLEGLCTTYGSTEANLVTVNGLDLPLRTGSCGKARPGFELRIVDDHDLEVPDGQVGELIVRSGEPWLQTQGYFNDPEATVRLCRNGWVHTGDAMRVDADGYYFFHDRYKDSLRRRGENVSSFEVEREVLGHDGVAEAACVAHPGEYGADDEIKVFVVPRDGAVIDPPELLRFLADRMTYFMVPRYLETIAALPKTPTQRVQKHLLRARGNTAATWDREAHGYRVTRRGLVQSEPTMRTEGTDVQP